MNMREKIARALAVAEGKDPDAPAWVRFPGGRPFGICWRDQYSKQADAVLAAMREPTEEMVESGCEARNMVDGTAWTDGTTEGVQAIERMLSERQWQAMIDAAGAA